MGAHGAAARRGRGRAGGRRGVEVCSCSTSSYSSSPSSSAPSFPQAWFRARLGAGVAEVPLGASAGGASDPRGAPRALDFGTQLARWVQGAGPQPVVDVAAPLHLQDFSRGL
ncbi:unnamed protein product [Prorocentrum cordatum]|uniref:Uncharacterized protein n=1 Tax=Prorocentrum cordatum TaxID=2364126 RepID=A0ABN9YA28_9DINO|nr:unnamed protein product [Polarella glacialis]